MEQNIVTGYLSTVSNGKQYIVSFNVSYARFAVAQLLIVSLMQTTALWGVAAALGVDPPAPEAGASTGDIEFEYVADFSAGGNSSGRNEWHGITEGAVSYIESVLKDAAGYQA